MITKEEKLRIELSDAQKYVCCDLLGTRQQQAPEGTAEETFQRCGVRLRIRSMGSLFGNPKGKGSGVHDMGVDDMKLLKYQEWIRPGQFQAGECDWDPYIMSDSTPALEGEAAAASIKQEDELGLELKQLQKVNVELNRDLKAARQTRNREALIRLNGLIGQLSQQMNSVETKREQLRQRRQFGVEGKLTVNPNDPKLLEIRDDCRATGGKAHQNVRQSKNHTSMPVVSVSS
eukprot:COSAG05_NODE_5048_length_1279_cov_1.372034_3_plen_232_part_00